MPMGAMVFLGGVLAVFAVVDLVMLVSLLRPGDERWQPQLTAAAGGRDLTFRAGQFSLGGLVVRSSGLGLQVDASFDSAAQDLSGHFAELFGLSLSDE